MADNKDLYALLGLKKEDNPTPEQIKKQYRKKSLEYHPDRHQNDSDEDKKMYEDKFKDVAYAYSILSDPQKKAKYDRYGVTDNSQMNSGFDPFSMFRDFGGDGSSFDPFADIRDMFGNSRSGNRHAQMQPGTRIQMRIPLSIEDVFNGVTKKVKYTIDVRCPNCHGTGGKTKQCPHCHGKGIITTQQQQGFAIVTQTRPCPHCHGTGEIVEQKCPSCDGTGFKHQEKILEVTFPAGILDGMAIEYSNQGNEAKKPGAPNGSFIAIAKWNFDTNRYTVFENGDVMEKINIPYYDALLGIDKIITLPNGKQLSFTIARGTPPGKKLRLSGYGITMYNDYSIGVQKRTGDYIIEINYDIPKKLSDDEIKLLEEIRKSYNFENK